MSVSLTDQLLCSLHRLTLCSFFLTQLPILASSVVSLYFLELTDIFQPVHSGYSCNDRSLSLPYILPKQEVCPLPLLFSLAFAAPTVTVSKRRSPPPLTIQLNDDFECATSTAQWRFEPVTSHQST